MRCPRVAENQLSRGTPWNFLPLGSSVSRAHPRGSLDIYHGMPGTAVCSARHDASHPPAVYCLHHLGAYAAWEWLVQIQTPEANIRADLLLIWPVLAVTSGWALFRAFRVMELILVFPAAAA